MIPVLIIPTLVREDTAVHVFEDADFPVRDGLIVNNGRGEVWRDWRNKNVAAFHVLDMPHNFGVAASWNLGIKSFPFAPWWMFASDDVEFKPGALEAFARECGPDRLTISSSWPHYQFFAVGENVVKMVGLFDENLYPANFEDDDYSLRVERAGFEIVQVDVPHDHVKQATVFHPEFASLNDRTYAANEDYFSVKALRGDVSAGEWSLDIRRANDWGI
jgi:hypothetical protein